MDITDNDVKKFSDALNEYFAQQKKDNPYAIMIEG